MVAFRKEDRADAGYPDSDRDPGLYEARLATHYDHVEDRRAHGIADGPVYRDIDYPNAALFHIRVESMDRAMEWFGSEKFGEASKRAKVIGREFYLARKREPTAASQVG